LIHVTTQRKLRAAILALFLVAFIPRAIYPVSRPLQWYERSFHFVDAVLHGRWADTIVSEHPGVAPMWLIGLAQHGYYALLRAWGEEPPHPMDIAGRAFHTEVAISVLPLALVIALGILLIWRLLRDVFDETAAWAGAGLLALDPFHIAISKVVHVDALLSVLMILSALTLLLYLQRHTGGKDGSSTRPSHRLLLASGVLAGLAFLTKSPSYFLVPYFGLSLLVTRCPIQSVARATVPPRGTEGGGAQRLRRTRLWQGYLAPLLLWGGSAALTYVLLWPAMWIEPIQTLEAVVAGIFKHAGRAHPQPLYYLGALTTEDPGPGYYLVSLLVKTTALSLPLFIVGLGATLTRRWRDSRRSYGLLIAYLAFFFVQMSLGAKKAPRYLLPVFPALDIIAGLGLVALARSTKREAKRFHHLVPWKAGVSPGALIVAALIAQAALVLPYHPYYVTHASLLAGGPAGGRRLLLATPEGEGLDLVAAYLNHQPQAGQLRVGVQLPAREAFRQHFVGQIADTREPDLDYLIFAEVYVTRHMAEDQWGEEWETYKHRLPEYTAYLYGTFFHKFKDSPYAWAYRVDEAPQPPVVPLHVCLGERIRLLGHTVLAQGAPIESQIVHPSQSIQITLHWAASAPPEGDYSVFVHLLGPEGTLVTQQDNIPLQGTYSTLLWKAGERLDDTYELTVPSDAPAGSYTLVAGMYDWRTGKRLMALEDCDSPLAENQITLARFEVAPQRVPWWQGLACTLAGLLVTGGLGLCVTQRSQSPS